MSNEDDINPPSLEDEILLLTQTTRRNIILESVESGLPTDSRDIRVLTELMASADTTALAIKKLTSDDDNSDADRRAALMAAKILSNTGNVNPFLNTTNNVSEATEVTLLEGVVKDVDVVPGELDLGVSTETYAEFIANIEDED